MDKFYGYGIVDKDGLSRGEFSSGKEEIERFVEIANDCLPDRKHRVVELFYKDEQS